MISIRTYFESWFSIGRDAFRPVTSFSKNVHWRLLPRAAARLAGWAWVLPFAALGWLTGATIYAGRMAWEAVRQGYRTGRVK